jgi:hypothetical protein
MKITVEQLKRIIRETVDEVSGGGAMSREDLARWGHLSDKLRRKGYLSKEEKDELIALAHQVNNLPPYRGADFNGGNDLPRGSYIPGTNIEV